MVKKAQAYKWIKVGGILSFVPVILISGPLAGYLVAEYLVKKFPAAAFIPIICIGIGFAASILETLRVIRLAIKIDKKDE